MALFEKKIKNCMDNSVTRDGLKDTLSDASVHYDYYHNKLISANRT